MPALLTLAGCIMIALGLGGLGMLAYVMAAQITEDQKGDRP